MFKSRSYCFKILNEIFLRACNWLLNGTMLIAMIKIHVLARAVQLTQTIYWKSFTLSPASWRRSEVRNVWRWWTRFRLFNNKNFHVCWTYGFEFSEKTFPRSPTGTNFVAMMFVTPKNLCKEFHPLEWVLNISFDSSAGESVVTNKVCAEKSTDHSRHSRPDWLKSKIRLLVNFSEMLILCSQRKDS